MPSFDSELGPVASSDMRLANITTPHGIALGVQVPQGILNITRSAGQFGMLGPKSVDDVLQHGSWEQVYAVCNEAARRPDVAVIESYASVVFLPPVMRPEKIICVGLNYRKHAEELGRRFPKQPPLFAKFRNALVGHNGIVSLPARVDHEFDYETELVIIMGKPCRDATPKSALDYVAGYTIGNDLSARTLQLATAEALAGKASDGFAPLGPWLVTRDCIPDPNNLRIGTRVNGEVRQDWTTGDMIFDCRELVRYCSSILTLQPGDLIFTGTPQGTIIGGNVPPEKRQWLKPGDEVISAIENLGELHVILAE